MTDISNDAPAVSRKDALAARVKAAQAKASAAATSLSQDDRDEIAAREEEAKALDAVRVAAREARLLALARAADDARDRYKQNLIDTLDVEDSAEGAGSYVLRNPPHADLTEWQARIAETQDAKQRDRLARNFAMACVITWIEVIDGRIVEHVLDDEKSAPAALHNLWTGRAGGAPTSITNLATDLAGFVAAKRKS